MEENEKLEQNLDNSNEKLHIFDISVRLDEGQLAFIEKCKLNGFAGCSITINNQQLWISFTNEH
jgi:hypothetical protein